MGKEIEMTLANMKASLPANWGFGTRISVEGVEYEMRRGWGHYLCWTNTAMDCADSRATIKDATLYRRHASTSPVEVVKLMDANLI
jgi:hypothetical protein